MPNRSHRHAGYDTWVECPQIIVLGYSEAAMLLRDPGSLPINAILSIHGQREFAVDPPHGVSQIVLRFDDAQPPPDDPIEASRWRLRQRDAADIGLNLHPPTIDDARRIIEFGEMHRNVPGAVLFQCLAGISRSPAAALLCLATWMGPGRERESIDAVLRRRPAAVPHRGLVEFGDELLGRSGALVAALADKHLL
jgi:predicted protein tyrosine phosphatase